jgi:hypothetical protein
MNSKSKNAAEIFAELGEAHWSLSMDAFVVRTPKGVSLSLFADGDSDIISWVHIDEIEVPEHMQRRGIANEAMIALCQLADRYEFVLKAGPIGWSGSPWRDKFVAWFERLGFVRDPSMDDLRLDDPGAFCVHRIPRATEMPGSRSIR